MADDEITAMSSVLQALDPLDENARARVLRWASERYGVAKPDQRQTKPNGGNNAQEDQDGNIDEAYADFAELFAAAGPATDADRVLVGGYWFQVIGGKTELESYEINRALRNLGHAVGTINKAFDRLIEQRPQLAIQLKKSGKSKQSRKKYRLTREGIERVRTMLSAEAGE